MKRESGEESQGEGVEIFDEGLAPQEKILPDLDFMKGERTFIIRENGKEKNKAVLHGVFCATRPFYPFAEADSCRGAKKPSERL